MEMSSQKEEIIIPQDVLVDAHSAASSLIPKKSVLYAYGKKYKTFCSWGKRKNVKGVNEVIVLAYLPEKICKCNTSSLWSYHSIRKKTIRVN